MPNKKFIVAIFNHESIVIPAIKKVREQGITIFDCYTPFPVHGMDDALGLKRSRLPIVAFCCGLTGTLLAVLMQSYMMGIDWPMDIGGKPHFPWPSFVPATFEITVLLASFGMAAAYYISSRLIPGLKNIILDARASDDKFVLAIELGQNTQSAESIKQLLKEVGAEEIKEAE